MQLSKFSKAELTRESIISRTIYKLACCKQQNNTPANSLPSYAVQASSSVPFIKRAGKENQERLLHERGIYARWKQRLFCCQKKLQTMYLNVKNSLRFLQKKKKKKDEEGFHALKRCKVVDGGRRGRSNEFIAMVVILFLILLLRRRRLRSSCAFLLLSLSLFLSLSISCRRLAISRVALYWPCDGDLAVNRGVSWPDSLSTRQCVEKRLGKVKRQKPSSFFF